MTETARQQRAARAYAARQWVPLPLNWVDAAGRCSCPRGEQCGNPGKHPRVRWADRTEVSADEIGRWWRWWPRAGVGIKTGAVSGLVVVDIDPRHDGDRSLAELVHTHGPLPATLTVETGGGGLHLYFAHPGYPVGNVQASGKLGDGIDVRGDGGQVAAPPTVHASGRSYRWQDWTAPLAEIPEWMADRLRPAPPIPQAPVNVGFRDRAVSYAAAALEGEVSEVLASPAGQRNNRLYAAAVRLGTLVGAHMIEDWQAAQPLLAAGIAAGLTATEAKQTILSGLSWGSGHPRQVTA